MTKRIRFIDDLTNTIKLTKKFEEEVMYDNCMVKSHIFEKLRLALQLQSKGYDIDEESLINVIINTLHPSWKSFVEELKIENNPKTVEALFDALVFEEEHQVFIEACKLCDDPPVKSYKSNDDAPVTSYKSNWVSSSDDSSDHVSATPDRADDNDDVTSKG